MTKPKKPNPSQPQNANAQPPKPPGRPPGSPNVKETAVAVPSRCCCGSTERGPYLDRHEQEYSGVDGAGQAFTHIVRRRCQCEHCGQMRIDVTRENRL